MTRYDSAFYSAYANESKASAREVVAIVNAALQPRSVVDVGCGIGTWLSIWKDLGVENVMGIDGSYVLPKDLLIPTANFHAMDLKSPTNDFNIQFDIVESLEVAEHLPREVAERFVSFLCSLGSVVLFSAAIPFQGGVDHINEQWPEYWIELFRQRGFEAVDALRPILWNNPRVAHYYAQNAVIFVRADRTDVVSKLQALGTESPRISPLPLVHPRKWHERNEQPLFLREWVRMFPKSLRFFLRRTRWRMARP